MHFLARLIITLLGCMALVAIIRICLKFVTNQIIEEFLNYRQLSEQILEKNFKFDDIRKKSIMLLLASKTSPIIFIN